MSHLRITGTVARATGFSARFDLELPLSGVTAVLGPSGAGKSTLLRGIAGFEPDAQLEVRIADLTLQSPGHTLPPHERPVSSVFQDSRLFPHLDVRGNLNYPLKQARREGFRMGFDEVVDSLALGDLLGQPIDTLSGGQRQRVALGRALLAPARLWLLDEPLSALDSAARADIAPYLDQLCQAHRLPILYVSHALEEVLQLADRALVIDAGEVVANVPIEDLGETPLGARLAASVLDCEAGRYLADHDLTELHLGPDSIHLRGALPDGQSHIRLLIHARDVSIAIGNVEGLSLLNRLHGRIRQIDHGAGGTSVVHLDCHGQRLLARITRLSAEQLDLQPGREVTALIKTVALATLNTQRLR